jgi:hypothetical protein
LVEVAGAPVVVTAPAVAVVLLMVLTAVLEVSVPVVVVLLKPPAVTVDSLASVSERRRIAERAARTYLVASLDVAVSVVVAGAWTPFRMSLVGIWRETYRRSGSSTTCRCASWSSLI